MNTDNIDVSIPTSRVSQYETVFDDTKLLQVKLLYLWIEWEALYTEMIEGSSQYQL